MTEPQSRPELCVGGVLIEDESILLVRRARPPGAGLWSIPGGRVEQNELMAAAVVREMFEETGLEVVCGALIGWVERIGWVEGIGGVERLGDNHHFVIFDFTVTRIGEDEPRAGDDAAEVAWVPVDDVQFLPTVPGLIEFLADHGIVETIT